MLFRIISLIVLLFFSTQICGQSVELVKDIRPSGGSNIFQLFKLDSNIIFRARSDKFKYQLWKSDGSSVGTERLTASDTANFGLTPSDLTKVDDKLYFEGKSAAEGEELWVSDGTKAGTGLVKDLTQGKDDTFMESLSAIGNKLFFMANTGNGEDPWISDGTASGTLRIKDIGGSTNIYQDGVATLNGKAFFIHIDSNKGVEPWITDGTTSGTEILKDIYPGNYTSNPGFFREAAGNVYFSANDGSGTGGEPYITDGTESGTLMLKDINPGGNSTSHGFTEALGLVFFTANNGSDGAELWKTDGTTSGTEMVADINPNGDAFKFWKFNGIEYQGKFYFGATDGSDGLEIWRTDGTSQGTEQFTDISPDTNTKNYPTYIGKYNGNLYFSVWDGKGEKLYETDGSKSSIHEIRPSIHPEENVEPSNGVVLNGKFYFAANFNSNGRELYELSYPVEREAPMAASDFKVYPNPAKNELKIGTNNYENSPVEISLVNLRGRKVCEKIWDSSRIAVIDIRSFNPGFYILRLKTEDGVVNEKVLIE